MALDISAKYPGKSNAPSSAYPFGSARNITTPGDGTGTPLEQAWLNDQFGFQQALINDAGLTPSGNPDTAEASQYLEAARIMLGAVAKSLAELSAVTATVENQHAFLSAGGRSGPFTATLADISAKVAGDPRKGCYIAFDSDPTGASGGWVRTFGYELYAEWFGAAGDGTSDDSTPLQASLDFAASLGGGSVRLLQKVYGVDEWVSVPTNVGLTGPVSALNTDGDGAVIKILATAVGKTLGTGSPIAGIVVEDATAVTLEGVQVDMSDAPAGSYGIISAGMWRSAWRSVYVFGAQNASDVGVLCCIKDIGWFWNEMSHVRVSMGAALATNFLITNAAVFGGSATGQPNQTTWQNCRASSGAFGWDIDGVGAGMVFINCQAEDGGAAGTAVRVQGATENFKPVWIGGEINSYGTGFDGDVYVLEGFVASGVTTKYTNGAVYMGKALEAVSKLFLAEGDTYRRRAKYEFSDRVTVPDNTATTIYTMDTQAGATNVDNLMAYITIRNPINAAQTTTIVAHLSGRFNVDQNIAVLNQNNFGPDPVPVFSFSGQELQLTQTGFGASVVVDVVVTGQSNR